MAGLTNIPTRMKRTVVRTFLKGRCLVIVTWCLALFPFLDRAADLTTTNVQASGSDWTTAIWRTNGTGAASTPAAGNTYQTIFNGTFIGNSNSSTRLRSPAVAGIQTFAGDSLTLNANTELRCKQVGAILNFPGVGGN